MIVCQQVRFIPPASRWEAKPKQRRRFGAVTLELAFVVPVFFLLVLGIIEIGRGFMVNHLLANAARDGCRLGILQDTSTAQVQDLVNSRLKAKGISGASVVVRVNGNKTEAAAAASGDKIAVNVAVPVKDFTWVPGGSFLVGSIDGHYSLYRE